jgi:hypothetical protein
MAFTQVSFDDFGVGTDLSRGTLSDFLAVIEDGNAFTDAHDNFHVVLDEKDRKLETILNEADEIHEIDLLGGVHASGGFVEEEELGFGGEGADDFQAALITVREIFGFGIGEAIKAENLEKIHNLGVDIRFFL